MIFWSVNKLSENAKLIKSFNKRISKDERFNHVIYALIN